MFLHELAAPGGDDLAVVVVGRDRVHRLADVLGRVVDERPHVVSRHGADLEGVAIAHPALVVAVVEIEGVEPLQDGPNDLARRARDSAVNDVRLVLGRGPLRVLRIELVVRLRVVRRDLHGPAQQPAGGVRLLHREIEGFVTGDSEDVEEAGQVMQLRHPDFLGGMRITRHPRSRGRGGSRRSRPLQEFSASLSHRCSPISIASQGRSTPSIGHRKGVFVGDRQCRHRVTILRCRGRPLLNRSVQCATRAFRTPCRLPRFPRPSSAPRREEDIEPGA